MVRLLDRSVDTVMRRVGGECRLISVSRSARSYRAASFACGANGPLAGDGARVRHCGVRMKSPILALAALLAACGGHLRIADGDPAPADSAPADAGAPLDV